MSSAALPPIFAAPDPQGWSLRRMSVDEYDAQIKSGVIPTSGAFELIDGLIVHKDRRDSGGDIMSIGPHHQFAVQGLIELSARLAPAGYHMRSQGPVVVNPSNEPEPDGTILRGTYRDYAGKHPRPDDIAVAFEVADSSLETDRGGKLARYERSGIRHYVIVNLRQGILESYMLVDGQYAPPQIIPRSGSLTIRLHDKATLDVSADTLLPPD